MKRFDRSARAQLRRTRLKPEAAAALEAQERVVRIEEMGARGEAVAPGPLYVPFALPGEEVRVRAMGERAELLDVLVPSAERRQAPCAHFTACGGCQTQHWSHRAALEWKRSLVVRALARRGVEAAVEPAVDAWGEGRRRATLHATRAGGGLKIGFMARGASAIVPIEDCPALADGMRSALPRLRGIAALFAPARGEVQLACLLTEAGLDVDVRCAAPREDRELFERAAAAAEAADLARLSLAGAPLVVRREPVLRMGAAIVRPPPGAFLQPTAAGEAALAGLVGAALAGAKRTADLFCGVGTFALRLAADAEVFAVDGDADGLAALKAAADGAGGVLKAVRIERRDLLRAPLGALELKRFDAAAFDPPRGGARLQAEQIARSGVRRVAAVSCDAAAFARDARALVDGGFRLERVTPVDQFRWSPHVEIVGAFSR